ncbi:hypothetical protein GSQ51_21270, partial [Clostridioides difficile]|nr:hypothetical protein [Clostridioides difficile]
QYAYKKAFELGRPVVINVSLGSSSLAGLTNRSNSEKAFFTRGTLIAIADTGIDYLHKDFIYPDGTSKIVYLWDQTKEGSPPE